MAEIRRDSEQYFAYVMERWSALPHVDEWDPILPPEILDSWRRSAAAGLLPDAIAPPPAPALNPYGLGRTFSFQGNNQDSPVFSVFAVSECSGITEEAIGTNAAALAYRLRRGVSVSGPEHYARYLHGHYCYAEPILNPQRQITGVCSVSSSNRQTTLQMQSLVHSLSCIGSSIYWVALNNRSREKEIDTVLRRYSQGAVYIDSHNIIRHFNRRALAVLGLKNSSEDNVIFTRCIAVICKSISAGRQSAIITYNNVRKEIYVTCIPLSENKYERLLLLEEKGGVSLSGAQNRAEVTFDQILAKAPAMLRIKEKAATAAAYNVPVMLVGKSGVGKEMFAQAIHNASPRQNGPFVALNASALAPNLVESALFGYEGGAFTGASQSGKAGYFEAALGGTLFLDELDSMPFEVQTKLLRALSSKQIRRVGGIQDISIDVRVISAGRVDLLELVRQGRFREDLYYRLSPVKLTIPPLAGRREDILLLTEHFLAQEAKNLAIPCPSPSPEFLDRLCAYDWPGNIRELHNVLCHVLIFLEPGATSLTPDLLPEYLMGGGPSALPSGTDLSCESTLNLAKMIAVCETLRCNGHSVERAGRQLGLSTATIYNYMTKARRCGLAREEEMAP